MTQRGRVLYSFFSQMDNISSIFEVLDDGEKKETNWKDCALKTVENIVNCLDKGGKPLCSMIDGLNNIHTCYEIINK